MYNNITVCNRRRRRRRRPQEAGNGCAREAGIQIVAHELSHFVNATTTAPTTAPP